MLPTGEAPVTITEEALTELVRSYCRESGVRSLEKHIEKVVRKVAYDIAIDQEGKAEEAAAASETTVETTVDSDHSKPVDVTIPVLPIVDASVITKKDEVKVTVSDVTTPAAEASVDTTPLLPAEPIVIAAKDLEKYVGAPRFTQDTIYDSKGGALPVGIVMGLAWNPLGKHPKLLLLTAYTRILYVIDVCMCD